MRKLLLSICLLLIAAFAGAQCNPTFTATPSPTGNSLLRLAVTNTTAQSWTGTRFANFWYVFNYPGIAATGSSAPGNVTYLSFTTPGTYSIGLAMVLRDSTNTATWVCIDTVYQSVTVGYTACASTISYNIAANGNYAFSATTPAGTAGMTYSWAFGDGSTATGGSATHTYAANGTYLVTLTATGGGCTYNNTATVQVTNIPVNCASNNAAYTVSANGATATFTNNSMAPTATNYHASYAWFFGDGPTTVPATTPTTAHTYAVSGSYYTYLVSTWYDSLSATTCRDTAFRTVTIIIPPVPNQIGLAVIRDTANTAERDSIRVWLISYDSAANSLRAIDSITTDSSGRIGSKFYSYGYFINVPDGAYLLKAARLGNHAGLNGPIPTYHDSSLYWAGATPVTVLGGNGSFGNVIHMRSGVAGSGPGFLSGNVSLGANRGTGAGVAGMTILLRNQVSSIAIRATQTDSIGNYAFSNVPAGLYSIYPEELDYTTMPLGNVAITNALSSRTNLDFDQGRTSKTIKPRATSIALLNANGASISLSPNPARGAVTLAWKGFDGKEITVTILNMNGQLMQTRTVGGSASGQAQLDISSLPAGIYSVRLHSHLGEAVQQLLIQP